MAEGRKLAVAILVTVLVAGGTYGFDHLPDMLNGYKVESYHATLYTNGTLDEQYHYDISSGGKYHIMYRSWETPVHLVPKGECIIPLNMSMDTDFPVIGYAKTHDGELRTYGGNADGYLVDKAEKDEVGFYAPGTFPSGDYDMRYRFRIFPDIEYDGSLYLLKFAFKGSGWSYGDIDIMIEDDGHITDVKASAYLNVDKEGGFWHIHGYDGYGLSAVVYIVMDDIGNMTHNSVLNVDDVMSDVNGFSIGDSAGYYILYYPYMALKWLLYIFPVALIIGYVMFGREKHVSGVSRTRVTPPVRRKPWIVALIFGKECESLGMDAFLATLLDLENQGKIAMEGSEIRILDTQLTDEDYERKVMNTLLELSDDRVVDLKRLKSVLSKHDINDAEYTRVKDITSSLRDYGDSQKICDEFLWTPKKFMTRLFVIPIILILAFILPAFAFRDYFMFYLLMMMFTIFFMFDLGAAYITPSLLGRWKGDYYAEKLEWEVFARTISDEKRFGDSVAEHGSLWRDWLIYGTALGIGNKVKKAMEEAGIPVESMYFTDENLKGLGMVYYGGIVSSGGSGGFSGGGFGGGGAGAR